MSVPYRITVRISEQVMQKLEDMVENFQFESVSDIIRLAISEFIEKNEGKGGTSKVDLVLPKKILEELEKDVDTGGAISLEDLTLARYLIYFLIYLFQGIIPQN